MDGIHTYFSSPWSACVFNRAGHLIVSTRDKLICFDANGRELRSQTEPLGPMLVVDGLLTIPRRGMVVAVPSEFSPFGPDHLVALLLTGLATALLVVWARGRRSEPVTEIPARVLALSMIAAQLADPYCRHLLGTLDWQHALPVEICDPASFACVFALLTRRPRAFELAYFRGLAGTLQALLTPAVAENLVKGLLADTEVPQNKNDALVAPRRNTEGEPSD